LGSVVPNNDSLIRPRSPVGVNVQHVVVVDLIGCDV
jgi:hypothetical protein